MKYKFIEAKIDDLQFDRLNPRFLRRFQEKDEKDIIEWMLSDATLFDLIASIGNCNFYPGEPLLVIESEQQGKYIVIVSNRRFVSCKILNYPALANVKYKRINIKIEEFKMEYATQVIPAFVFYKREDILVDLDYNPGPQLATRWWY